MAITWFDRCAVVVDLFVIIKAATFPTLRAAFKKPTLFFRLQTLRDVFFENVWAFMGDSVDERGAMTKRDLLPRARGVVLELGAGHGHNCKYLDKTRVTKYIALEPNPYMHEKIVENATKAGFQASQIQIIGHGAEKTAEILEALNGGQVDTLVSILTLCGIPNTEETLKRMIKDLLKPGGQLLFYEHVRCDPEPTLVWWQTFWTFLWEPLVGCRLDQPTHVYIERASEWDERGVWGKLPEEVPKLFWHRVGCYRKKED
ncbi:hypothetical protein FRC18_001268 [Serendipita sp. 400]|nr:hypothetical protein FRC18_001268 [Serendipita sp. 400]